MTDDLTRRAIIAAHDAECPCAQWRGDDATTYRPLTKREQAIVARWREDRDDYQGRYETAHESFLASERDRDVSEAGRRDEKEIANAALAAAAKEQQRAEKAERAAQTLNGVVEQHARMILDITGLHDRIDDDGDGDWGAIWDHAHELRPRAEAAEAAIERVHEYAREQDDHSVPASSEEAWELSTRREVSRELTRLLETDHA